MNYSLKAVKKGNKNLEYAIEEDFSVGKQLESFINGSNLQSTPQRISNFENLLNESFIGKTFYSPVTGNKEKVLESRIPDDLEQYVSEEIKSKTVKDWDLAISINTSLHKVIGYLESIGKDFEIEVNEVDDELGKTVVLKALMEYESLEEWEEIEERIMKEVEASEVDDTIIYVIVDEI